MTSFKFEQTKNVTFLQSIDKGDSEHQWEEARLELAGRMKQRLMWLLYSGSLATLLFMHLF